MIQRSVQDQSKKRAVASCERVTPLVPKSSSWSTGIASHPSGSRSGCGHGYIIHRAMICIDYGGLSVRLQQMHLTSKDRQHAENESPLTQGSKTPYGNVQEKQESKDITAIVKDPDSAKIQALSSRTLPRCKTVSFAVDVPDLDIMVRVLLTCLWLLQSSGDVTNDISSKAQRR